MSKDNDDRIQNAIDKFQAGQPDDLVCPITCERFNDPVIAGDGHIYEKAEITRWITEHGTSPLTRQSLRLEDIHTDEIVSKAIARHYEGKPFNVTVELKNRRRQNRRKRRRRSQQLETDIQDTDNESSAISTITQNIPLSIFISPNIQVPTSYRNRETMMFYSSNPSRRPLQDSCYDLCQLLKRCPSKITCSSRSKKVLKYIIYCFFCLSTLFIIWGLPFVIISQYKNTDVCTGKTGMLGMCNCFRRQSATENDMGYHRIGIGSENLLDSDLFCFESIK